MSKLFSMTGHGLRVGDRIRRGLHGSRRFTLGRVYEVKWVNADRSLSVVDDNGTNTRTHANLYYPATEGEPTMYPQAPQCAPAPRNLAAEYQNMPKAAPPSTPSQMGQQVTVEEMRALADRVEAEQEAHAAADATAQADREEREAINAKLRAHTTLANATIVLLDVIRDLLVHRCHVPGHFSEIATHRKALAGLAEFYGCKIVLVGDKTSATVVKV